MRSIPARFVAATAVGAALVLVPLGASAQTVPNPIDVEDPFSVISLPNEPAYNIETNWTIWLTEIGAPGVACTKYENPVATPFVVPDVPSDTEEWALAVVKSGSDQSVDSPNDLVWFPFPEEALFHSSENAISHVILCSAEAPDETETTPPTTPPMTGTSTTTTGTSTTTTGTSTTTTGTTTTTTPVTGPVVETDRPAGGDLSQVGLFAGAAALLAAGAAVVLGRRRQSAEH